MHRRPIHRQAGVAYLALMIALAIIAVVAAHAIQLGSIHGQRAAEEDLLQTGLEFQQALQRYGAATPAGLPRAPLALHELVRDPRYPGVVRHLRQVRADPITGKLDWGVVRDANGRIVGVHSRSPLQPIRETGFAPALADLQQQPRRYDAWVFWGPVRQPAQ